MRKKSVIMKKRAVFIANVSKMGRSTIIVVPKKIEDLFIGNRVMVEVYEKEEA